MERSAINLIGFRMEARDGEIGKVEEFYFHDDTWTIRYLIVKTGNWFREKEVLISTVALIKGSELPGVFPVNLTMDQIRTSPDIDTQRPVSRQHEVALYEHYPWQNYWGSSFYTGGIWDIGNNNPVVDEPYVQGSSYKQPEDDQHLRSTRQVTGYQIQCTDGEFGQVTDFIIDDDAWKIRYLLIKMHPRIGMNSVLLPVRFIIELQWLTSKILVDMTIEVLKNSPQIDPTKIIY
jgi:PRC-barrel domain